MKKQAFQHAEIRDENDNIISAGAYGKNTALSNAQNDGWVDYVMNNLERLQESIEDNAKSNDSTNQKLTDYAKTTEVDNKLTNYAKKESLVGLASTEYVDGRIQHVVGTAPEALDTLGEIATALTDNKDKIGTIITEISTKADKGTVENALMGKAEKANVYTKQKVNDLLNLLQRNKSYQVGDIVNSAKLPSYLYLECVQAGTTGSTEPELSTGGVVVNDGSCKFRVMDRRMKAMIDVLYPIGIVITTATDNTPKPGEEYGLAQWEEIGQDRVLQGCSTGAGNTIEAGLPNITGTAAGALWGFVNTERSDGAFRNSAKEGLNNSNNGEFLTPDGWDLNKDGIRRCSAIFDASKSNSIYGKSNTVQPSALKVHFWKRIS